MLIATGGAGGTAIVIDFATSMIEEKFTPLDEVE
jgi:hypothetical protein